MVRQNRNRGRGRRNYAPRSVESQRVRELENQVKHIINRSAFEVRCPPVPPPIRMTTKINKTIRINLFGKSGSSGTSVLSLGWATEPAFAYMSKVAFPNRPASSTFTVIGRTFFTNEIMFCANASMIRYSLIKDASFNLDPDIGIDPSKTNLFTSFRMRKVSVWGSAQSGSETGMPVELTVFQPIGPSLDSAQPEATTVRAVGSRTQRAHCSLSVPQPGNWAVGPGSATGYGDGTRLIQVQVAYLGPNEQITLSDDEPLAILHVTFEGIIDSERSNTITYSDYIRMCEDEEFSSDIEVISNTSSKKSGVVGIANNNTIRKTRIK